ncbi:MAG: hypothetical protein R3E73_01280 [Porticoccaceae bacterium]
MKKYCLTAAVFVLCSLAAIVGFNLYMDPFNIFQLFPGELNANKASLNKYARFGKMATLYIQKPEAVILGSSRSEFGLSAYQLEELTGYSAYNASLSGANFYEVYRAFQQAAQNDLKLAVIGIDLFMFNVFRKDSLEEGQMFSVSEDGKLNKDYLHHLLSTSLLSWNATSASVRSLRKSKRTPSYRLDGRRNEESRAERIIHQKGYEETFREVEKMFFKSEWFSCGSGDEGFSFGNATDNRMILLTKIIDLANKKDIKLIFIISPTHARLFEAMSVAGLWDDFELWKRQLVKTLPKKPSGQNVELWDFSGYSAYSTELIPEDSDPPAPMQWYLETSHYTSALGNIVLSKVFSDDTTNPFGKKITTDNIEHHLSELRYQQLDWRQKNPAWHEDLKNIYTLARQEPGSRAPCPDLKPH